ncbi:hypothetical protein PR048_018882 [Dryococelus australis]|uniref:Uncharacterized protein n=1 Tax=Dryococelus australis TaxID=614101 RepID=A0ABQ9H218_9NEOP|nr:hypothetical protein PR048_018882 [Dryococelus australis]
MLNDISTAMAERLYCSPPTNMNRVQSPAGTLQYFCKWESCRTMPLVGGFSRVSPVSTAPASGAPPFSPHFALSVSQDLVVTSRYYSILHFTSRLAKRKILLTSVFEVSKEQRWNEGPGETGDPRENPPSSSIVQLDTPCENPGSEPAGGLNPVRLGGRRWLELAPHKKASRVRSRISHLYVGIVPHDVGGSGFSRGSPVSTALAFWRCSILTSLHPQRALKTAMLRAAQISSLHYTV